MTYPNYIALACLMGAIFYFWKAYYFGTKSR